MSIKFLSLCQQSSVNWPDCACVAGTAGSLAWEYDSQAYSGTCITCSRGTYQDEVGQPACQRCDDGFYAFQPTKCSIIDCPPYATAHPMCMCQEGYYGKLFFNKENGEYLPKTGCQLCSVGYWSPQNSETCEQARCPVGSSGHPVCQCPVGYNGTIIWDEVNRMYHGDCYQADCPPNAGGNPNCECMAGFKGELMWSERSSNWIGACVPCPIGQASYAGDGSCFNVDCPPNASGYPNCKCNVGFVSTLTFVDGDWRGECIRCPDGYRAIGGACEQVYCPDFAAQHPKCNCKSGHETSSLSGLTWDVENAVFNGSCVPCKKGYWSAPGGFCEKISCPPNSDSHPDCRCSIGYQGTVTWDPYIGMHSGSCELCPAGYSGDVNYGCTKAHACPDHSVGFPDCTCLPMFYGAITWNFNSSISSQGAFVGKCEPCPKGTRSIIGQVQCITQNCPSNAISWPDCECEAGFAGTIFWNSDIGAFVGTCSACAPGNYASNSGMTACQSAPLGYWTSQGTTESLPVACPSHASNHPNCTCDAGYSGKLGWLAGNWTGTCEPCSTGYISLGDDQGCLPKSCPENSFGHPSCRCAKGFMESPPISWNPTQALWLGGCQQCPQGFDSNSSNPQACKIIECPVGSDSHPNCQCKENYFGQVRWESQLAQFVGSCEFCGHGQVVGANGCENVPCPENAVNYPHCRCKKGFEGNISYSFSDNVYLGTCKTCPYGKTSSREGAFCELTTPCPQHSVVDEQGLCQCQEGYNGTISWNQDTSSFSGACSEPNCPFAASKFPNCTCNDGYEVVIPLAYDHEANRWTGECKPCEVGFRGQPGISSCQQVLCPLHSSGHPTCTCNEGYAGSIYWNSNTFAGACQKCQVGYKASETYCSAATCPANSLRIESADGISCECQSGYEGTISWTGLNFIGQCVRCKTGYWSTKGACVKVLCPENSINHPNCNCLSGYFGYVSWSTNEGLFQGQCIRCGLGYTSQVGDTDCAMQLCPKFSSGHPNCACDAPNYNGKLVWDYTTRKYLGECMRCPTGYWSDGNECRLTPCPTHSTGYNGHCVCDSGYSGALVWDGPFYHGSCDDCGVGRSSADGGACKPIACPANSNNYPTCTCMNGYSGVISWNGATRTYLGSCMPCPPGQWSLQGGLCTATTCPANSSPISASDGSVSCACNQNFYGTVHWHQDLILFVGVCQTCGVGYRSGINSIACQAVSCPDGSAGHPHCMCNAGMVGGVFWNANMGAYIGACIVPASTSPIPSFSPSFSPSKSQILPSASFVLPTSTASFSPSATPIFSPSSTPCIEHQLTVSGAQLENCNGLYTACGLTHNYLPIFCKDNKVATLSVKIYSDGSKWYIAESSKQLYMHEKSSSEVPPASDWQYLGLDLPVQSSIVILAQCSGILYLGLRLHDIHSLTISMQENVAITISTFLHLSRVSQFFL
jgi:hypothetical protein